MSDELDGIRYAMMSYGFVGGLTMATAMEIVGSIQDDITTLVWMLIAWVAVSMMVYQRHKNYYNEQVTG